MNQAPPHDGVIAFHATVLRTGKTSTAVPVTADVVAPLQEEHG